MGRLVLHSTAYNLGMLDGDVPSLVSAVTKGAASLPTASAPTASTAKKRIAALLLTPPEPEVAKVLQKAIKYGSASPFAMAACSQFGCVERFEVSLGYGTTHSRCLQTVLEASHQTGVEDGLKPSGIAALH